MEEKRGRGRPRKNPQVEEKSQQVEEKTEEKVEDKIEEKTEEKVEEAQVVSDYEPLEDDPDRKPYAVHSDTPAQDIPEPIIGNSPPVDNPTSANAGVSGNGQGFSGNSQSNGQSSGFSGNGAQKTEPKTESKSSAPNPEGAEAITNFLLAAYKELFPKPFVWLSQFNMKKLNRLHREGEINLNASVMLPDNSIKTEKQFCEAHNDSMKNEFDVSDDMINQLKGPLSRTKWVQSVSEKMTPEVEVLVVVGMHCAMNAMAVGKAIAVQKEAIEHFKNMRSDEVKARVPVTPAPQQKTEEKKEKEPTLEDAVNLNAKEQDTPRRSKKKKK